MAGFTSALLHLLGGLLGALLAAFTLQLAAVVAVKFKPAYLRAYLAAYAAYVSSLGIGFATGLVSAEPASVGSRATLVLIIVGGFLVQAYLYGVLLKPPAGAAIGFRRGLTVALLQTLFIGLVIVLLAGLGAVFAP